MGRVSRKKVLGEVKPVELNDNQFICYLNEYLSRSPELPSAEPSVMRETPAKHIWVLGLPRSGTTLAMQLLAEHLKIGYVDNYMARFWSAPYIGAELSNILLKTASNPEYKSSYGTTSGVHGPHEFSYFWRSLLRVDDFDSIHFSKKSDKIDWARVKQLIDAIALRRPTPMGYKAWFPAYFPKRIQDAFPNSMWVLIERPVEEVALSLVKGRERYFGTREKWLSMHTEGYEAMLEEPYWRQIGWQIYHLRKLFFDRVPEAVPQERILWTSYNELCDAPLSFLNRIREKAESLNIGTLRLKGDVPESFIRSCTQWDSHTIEEIRKGLKEYGLETRSDC